MKQRTRLIVGIGAILFGSFQIYKATVLEKRKSLKTKEMLNNLYQHQQEYQKKEAAKEDKLSPIVSTLDSVNVGLDKVMSSLDSIEHNLKEISSK